MRKTSALFFDDTALDQLTECLAAGYSLKDSLYLLAGLYPVFMKVNERLEKGMDPIAALAYYLPDENYKETFLFLADFTSLEAALQGAKRLGAFFSRFKKTLLEKLAYPFFLTLLMMGFSLVMSWGVMPSLQALTASFQEGEKGNSVYLSLLTRMPFILFVFGLFVLLVSFSIYRNMKKGHRPRLLFWLRVPFVGGFLKSYYSLKFASYFMAVSEVASGLYDAVRLMKKQLKQSDIMVVLYPLSQALENGEDLTQALLKEPFFEEALRHFLIFLDRAQRPFSELETYTNQCLSRLEKKISRAAKTAVGLVYMITAVFIIGIYLGMLLPMIELAGEI